MRTLSIALGLALAWAAPAWAMPVAPQAFCDTYPDAPRCIAGVPACTFCHMGAPPDRNVFGKMIEDQLLPGAPRPLDPNDFLSALPEALHAIEDGDADGDGFTNLDEILSGTLPADDLSIPPKKACGGGVNPDWSVCNYDARYVFKKLRIDFCGQSPTYAELMAFDTEPDQAAALDRELDRCLDSDFWIGKDGQLWRLAHRKIRPIKAIKQGEDGGPIPLADYYDDYNLFVWTQTDDHDARDVLLADYFVTRRSNPTSYAIAGVNDPTGDQSVVPARRAGMITTRWYLILNVMFTALPRTAAAQAYRSFLGLDVAKSEGLFGVPGEPVDYDEKGVTAEYCARCHSTLDPLSYPFRNYQGLTGNIGSYEPNRIENDFSGDGANIGDMPEAGSIFGQPVANLNEWATVAANSKRFAEATVKDYWKLLVALDADSNEEFPVLWQNFMDPTKDDYRVERMLHALIRTEAYGVP